MEAVAELGVMLAMGATLGVVTVAMAATEVTALPLGLVEQEEPPERLLLVALAPPVLEERALLPELQVPQEPLARRTTLRQLCERQSMLRRLITKSILLAMAAFAILLAADHLVFTFGTFDGCKL